jgi:hypothetical protein
MPGPNIGQLEEIDVSEEHTASIFRVEEYVGKPAEAGGKLILISGS